MGQSPGVTPGGVPYIFHVGVRGFVGGTKYFGRVPWPVTYGEAPGAYGACF